MYQPPPFGYGQGKDPRSLRILSSAPLCNPQLLTTSAIGAPGLAPGLSAPASYPTQVIPPNFNFNAPVIHFGQSLSGATIISTPDPSSIQPAPAVVRPTYIKEPEGPRLAPTAEDQLHTVFVGNIPDDLSDEWMDRIARVEMPLVCMLI
jgi:hypothetical protein